MLLLVGTIVSICQTLVKETRKEYYGIYEARYGFRHV